MTNGYGSDAGPFVRFGYAGVVPSKPEPVMSDKPISDETLAKARRVEELLEECQRVLDGQNGTIEGAVIARLLSLWLAGHPETDRELALTDFIDMVREMVPESEKEILQRAELAGRA